ncbi:hypothetical protein PAXRUDRAFT_44094, partial [Paxillus rubicundulus Ve08.2h10]
EKDDLIMLAGALTLMMEGTVADLTTCIKEHLTANPQCADEPHFATLFSNGRKQNAGAAGGTSSIPPLTGSVNHSTKPLP